MIPSDYLGFCSFLDLVFSVYKNVPLFQFLVIESGGKSCPEYF